MADDKSPKKKRLVKNPETFRERAVKATEYGEKPGLLNRFFGSIFRAIKFVLRPFVRAFKWFFGLRIMKPFVAVFRFIGRIIFPKYFRESWRELKLVTWPNWKQSRQLTFAVLVFALVFGVVIAIVDYGLDKLFRNILLK